MHVLLLVCAAPGTRVPYCGQSPAPYTLFMSGRRQGWARFLRSCASTTGISVQRHHSRSPPQHEHDTARPPRETSSRGSVRRSPVGAPPMRASASCVRWISLHADCRARFAETRGQRRTEWTTGRPGDTGTTTTTTTTSAAGEVDDETPVSTAPSAASIEAVVPKWADWRTEARTTITGGGSRGADY